MPITDSYSITPGATLALAQTRDPFAILSDLEITLILSFLSVEDTIRIRRVSTLWRACVDFRLSKAAIGRRFPGTKEAEATYSSWEEEALAFRRLAHRDGTCARPTVARKFSTAKVWCVCNHHMVWVDTTHIHIQRLWDPNNPTVEEFPIKRRSLKFPFESKPWNVKYLVARWMGGDDESGTVILYLGLPYREQQTHARWLLAVSVTTGKALWHQKHDAWIQHPIKLSRNTGIGSTIPVSFGHGKLCFVETDNYPTTHGTLVVTDLATGKQQARQTMPQNHFTLSYNLGSFGGANGFATHPTKEVYLLMMGRELWVFSTKTAELLKSYTVPAIPSVHYQWNACYFRFGKKSGGQVGEMIWLLVEGNGSILSYEIEPENFQIVRQVTWSLNSHIERSTQTMWNWTPGLSWPAHLNPVSGIAYFGDLRTRNIVVVKFEPTPMEGPVLPLGTPDYCIKFCEYLSLPPKKEVLKRRKRGKGSEEGMGSADNNESEPPNGRREFKIEQSYNYERFQWTIGPYIAMETRSWVSGSWTYVLGFVPRW